MWSRRYRGLRDASDAVGVLGHAGDRQELVDAADGEHQPVVSDLPGPVLGVHPPHLPFGEIDAVDLAQDEPDIGQRLGHRHRHPAGLEQTRGDLRQQRHVQEVVGRVHDHDVGPAAAEP